MRASIPFWISLFFAGVVAACSTAPPLPETDDGPRIHEVHVASNGWHTAIIMKRSKADALGRLPEADDFPDAVFLEFGWGDRKYYPADEKTVGMVLAAAFASTPAVVHVAGLTARPQRHFPNREMISLVLTKNEFGNMVEAISDDFQRPESGRAKPVSQGLYPNSHFYHAHGSFHLFNTCNTWTARILRAGGVAINPSGIITADQLMGRLRAVLDENRTRRADFHPSRLAPSH